MGAEGNLLNLQAGAASNEATQGFANQAAAQKAVELYKQGDIRGAYGVMMAADPAFAQKIAPQLTAIDPELAGQLKQSTTEGDLTGQTKFGTNQNQLHTMDNQNHIDVANINAAASIKAAQAKANQPLIRSDPTSPTGFSILDKQTGTKRAVNMDGQIVETPATKSAPGTQTTEAPAETSKPKLVPGEKDPTSKFSNTYIDSNGKPVSLSKDQLKAVDTASKDFDKETKDIVKSINDGTQALEYIDKNIPGSQTVEKLRILKSVVSGRINQQEFAAFGKGNGILANIDNAISEAAGKGMSPQIQDNMRRLVRTALDVTTKEYDQALKNRVERASSAGVDPLIVKRKLIGSSGPTPYQDALEKIKGLPPQAQGLYSWVHDNLDSKDPATRAKAQQFQQSLKQKYGF